MKRFYLLALALLFTAFSFAQKKEKIKGSKTVTVAQREIGTFENIEIEDNLQVYLSKGGAEGIEIEADDNLHEVIMAEVNGGTLRLYTAKEATGAKSLSVRITYTDNLKTITAKNEVIVNALADLQVENITVNNLDYSKSYLNVKSANFTLVLNDKATAEVNSQGQSTTVEMSKNAELKALIASPNVKIDMYQKTIAVIEGDAENAIIRLDNNAAFTGKKFTAKNMELIAEGYTTCNVMATDSINIAASGKSETELFGKPKVSMSQFSDSAVLYKREQ